MRKLIALVAAALLAVTPAFAELPFTGYTSVGPATGASTALDDTIALYVKYVGSTAGKPTVEVNAAGDILFTIAGSADTTVGCPTATGTIDVSNAACNTFLEVINSINASGSNWRAAPGAMLGSESTDNTLKVLSATDTDVRIGKPLYFDNSNVDVNADLVSVVLGPPSLQVNGAFWFQGNNLNSNPFGDLVSFFSAFSEKKTSGGTIGQTIIYGIKSVFADNASRTYSETVRTAWTETGGATATENQTDFSNFPLVSAPGERFVLRVSSSTSITVTNVVGAGIFAKVGR